MTNTRVESQSKGDGHRYIICQIGKGLFEHECSITVSDIYGEKYQAIVDRNDVKVSKEPEGFDFVDGVVRVRVVEVHPGKIVVDLPQETFTSGPRITVSPKELAPR